MSEDTDAWDIFPREVYSEGDYPEMPVWGKLLVYGTREEAINSLSAKEKEEQLVSLILVAGNRQLKAILDPGREICRPQAALYLRIAESCPMYYITWERDGVEGGIEVVSRLHQKGKREEMLDAVRACSGKKCYLIGRVSSGYHETSGSETIDPIRPLRVCPRVSVVGNPGFLGEDIQECENGKVA